MGEGTLMPTSGINYAQLPFGLNKLITCKGIPLRATLTITHLPPVER